MPDHNQPPTQLLHPSMFPDSFAGVDELEAFMSTPTAELVDDLARIDGDVIILGVAGKIGICLARMVKRAAPGKRVVGVSRFSEEGLQAHLNGFGVETIRCDLLDKAAVEALPKLRNVIYMAGLKFDTKGREDFLWAMNTIAPGIVAEAFHASRIVAFSTTHVYAWSNPMHGGLTERAPPFARPGEYANSVVGRERTFQYYSRLHGTPGRIARLAYAIDMRYGVLQEIAAWVLAGKPIPVETGHVNIIWQGDAAAQIIRLLGHCDPVCSPINIGGPECVSVRKVATDFGEIFGVAPSFAGEEQPNCLFVNCDQAAGLLGNPVVPVSPMVRWVAEWAKSGKSLYGKPSKFEVRSGVF